MALAPILGLHSSGVPDVVRKCLDRHWTPTNRVEGIRIQIHDLFGRAGSELSVLCVSIQYVEIDGEVDSPGVQLGDQDLKQNQFFDINKLEKLTLSFNPCSFDLVQRIPGSRVLFLKIGVRRALRRCGWSWNISQCPNLTASKIFDRSLIGWDFGDGLTRFSMWPDFH